MGTADVLDDVFFALADGSRRHILARLADGEAAVGVAAEGLELSPPTISKHVKVLERAGLVRRRVEGREHRLSLVPDGFATAAGWLTHHEAFWSASVDRLADLVAELADEEGRR